MDLLDDLGILNLDYLLVDVLGVTHHIGLSFLEGVDGRSALLDVLVDRQREPVVVLGSLIHVLVKFLDIVTQKPSLDWSKIAYRLLVASKELVEFVHVTHIVLLLKSNIDYCLRNGFADSAQEFGFANGDPQLWRKVDFINVVLFTLLLAQDVLLQVLDGLVGVLIAPLVEDLFFVLFIEFLGEFDVHGCHILELVGVELFGLGLEFADRSFDPSHNGTSPGNATSVKWHVLRDWRIVFSSLESFSAVVEQLFHDFELFLVLVEHIIVLLFQLVLDRFSRSDVLELAQEVEGRFRGVQLLRECLVNEGVDCHINVGNVAVEALELGSP
jgi:hypothetical protein